MAIPPKNTTKKPPRKPKAPAKKRTAPKKKLSMENAQRVDRLNKGIDMIAPTGNMKEMIGINNQLRHDLNALAEQLAE